ncbi:hypothetical protein BROUX41_002996 [Berkeleyomyces rouxiae]|uniref:uncharacterized protein n=1 Tax=Berkeleyomyces rouxiae TaxID=2035830 RepID=UPI003B822C43
MPAVQSQVAGPGTFLVTRDLAKASIAWIIGAAVGGSVIVAGVLSIVLYMLSVRRKRAMAASRTSSAESPVPVANLQPLDSGTTLNGSLQQTTTAGQKNSVMAFFRPRQKPYVGSLTRKNKLRKTSSTHRPKSVHASIGSPRAKGNWIDDDALHGPSIMQHLAHPRKSQSLENAWVVGSPTLPDITMQEPAEGMSEAEKERERFYSMASGTVPYPMFSGKRADSTATAASSFTLHGYGLHSGSFPIRHSSATSATGITSVGDVGVVSPQTPPRTSSMRRGSSVTSSSDKELQEILRNTDQRLLRPTNAPSALFSIMRTPTSAKNRSLRGSPSRTPVYATTPQSSSPEKAQLASTLNVAKWQILTAQDMDAEPSILEYASESEDGDHIIDEHDEDIHGSILTHEFSTVLSPAGSFVSPVRQSVEEDDDVTQPIDLTAELESARAELHGNESRSPSACSTVSSALSTLYSVDEREDAPSPPASSGAMSDTSTKLGHDVTGDAESAVDDVSSGDDPFSPVMLSNFPKTKHLSVMPLSPSPLRTSRKVYSCPPPRRPTAFGGGDSPLKNKAPSDNPSFSASPSSKVMSSGSPIRQRQPATKMSAPPFASPPSKTGSPKSSAADFEPLPMKRVRPATPGNLRRSSSAKTAGSASMADNGLVRKSSLIDSRVRAVMLQNNDNARMITPIKGHQIRIVTPSASMRSRALAAKQKQRMAEVQKHNVLRPMRSSPTLGSHDHGNASVSSPATSGSSSPDSASNSVKVFGRAQPAAVMMKPAVPTVVVSTLRSASTNSLLTSYSGTSLLSMPDNQLTPSPSFQMAMSRGAGPSGVYIPQSISSSSFDLTPATALDITITELRRRNSQTPQHRSQSYAGPPTVMTVGMGIMDSPTLPHRYNTMRQHNRAPNAMPPVAMTNYNKRRRTHTGMTSSGSVSHLSGPSRLLATANTAGGRGCAMPAPKRRQLRVASKASREDMRAGIVQMPLPMPKVSGMTRKSSLKSAPSVDDMVLPQLTPSASMWTQENLLATPNSKPGRKPSVTFAQTDDVLLLSDDSNFHNLTLYDDAGVVTYSNSYGPSKLSEASMPGAFAH